MSEITPNTPNPVREDAYVEELSEKLGIDPQYIPKSPVWRNEEEIKAIAEMFANMSGGSSGGGVLVVNVTEPEADLHVCDKTAGEMLAACKTGIVVFVETGESNEKVAVCTSASLDDMGYLFKRGTANYGYSASSSTDYPTYDDR